MDSQLNRLKSLTDDLQRQLTELNNAKSRLTSENFELLHINQDYEAQILNYSKAKSSLESQVDDLKRSLDDEAKVNPIFFKYWFIRLKNFNYSLIDHEYHLEVFDCFHDTTIYRRTNQIKDSRSRKGDCNL